MRYPMLKQQAVHRETVDTFQGYNHNLRIGPGEFYDMKNLSSDCFPVLSPRKKRGLYAQGASIGGITAKEQLCYVDGKDFVIGSSRYGMGLEDGEKQLVSMGAYVIILPDKKFINTVSPEDRGDMEAAFTSTAQVSFSLCALSGEEYKPTVRQTPPENPDSKQFWLDTSGDAIVLKRYSTAGWIVVSPTYIKISSPGLGKDFREQDAVRIRGVQGENLQDLNGVHTVWGCGEDHIIVTGIIQSTASQTGPVTLERRLPEMDFVTESGNRLWGCRYGINENGEQVNEIYASKLGDFRNWNSFLGLSTDSYAASCGTDGPFTGAVTYLDSPMFFKENCLHRVYGSYPANFQIHTTTCRGVQKGSHKSLAIVGETLYYKSPGAVCAYDGSLPGDVSYPLGTAACYRAAAGAVGNKYYISMEDEEGVWHLFVYDTARRLWHKEDNLRVDAFCTLPGELYALEHGTGRILALLGGGDDWGEDLHWMAETGEIGISSPDMKYVSRLTVRLSLDVGTEVRFYARYDFSEEWEPLFALRSNSLRSFSIPIKTRRCDHMKVRIEGDGGARIYSLTKTIEEGSDIS